MNLTDEKSVVTPTTATTESDLLQAKQLIAGTVPLMPDPSSMLVDLARGIRHGGSYQTRAEVRELTGADEEILARTKRGVAGFVDYLDAFVALGTAKIGSYDLASIPFTERRSILGGLLTGDRERLILAIMQATYGDTKTLSFTCGKCGAEGEVDLVFSEDLKIKDVEGLQTTLNYQYTTRKGEVIEYRLVTGTDFIEALNASVDNAAEQNTVLLSRCIVKVGDQNLIVDPMKFARDLTIRDRQAILKSLVELQPGVDTEVRLPCARCQDEQRITLGWADLFPA